MRRLSRSRCFVMLATLATALVVIAPAGVAKQRYFSVGDRGGLELSLPDDWVAESSSHIADPSFRLTAPGREFIVHAAVRPLAGPTGAPALERARSAVEHMAAGSEVREHAEDPNPPIKELSGPRATGYYFLMTDKLWTRAPNDYHYLSEGTLVTGTLTVGFRILANAPSDREAALDVLRTARHVSP